MTTAPSEPTILVYARRQAGEQCDWLLAQGCPGTILTASTPDEARPLLPQVDILVTWQFPGELFPLARRLRWIQSMGAGVDGLMRTRELPADVTVTRIVGQFDRPITEYVFAELLARVRKLDDLRALQAARRWERISADTLVDKTIGIAGLGSIGGELARTARAFSMRVFGLSRTGQHGALVERHFEPDRWLDFVRELDILVLVLPLTAQTAGVVNREVLGAMKPTSLLVNVGRGGLVAQDDLIDALRSGRIAGAILDVVTPEPLPPDNPLWSLPGVTVTPHISGVSTVDGTGAMFLRNLRHWLAGEPLEGVVDRGRGY